MYDFIDTITTGENNDFPVEAVSINGEFIEDLISGFRTLYTSGRESLEKQIATFEDTRADGSQINYTRFPSRTITVGFQLITHDAIEFREKFNALNTILNVEDAVIIFADETDKFFVGNPVFSYNFEPGRNAVTGEYQIFCPDPFKYAVEETIEHTKVAYTTDGAEEYNASATYEIGSICMYNGRVYECIADITTPEAWNLAHWNPLIGSAFDFVNDGGYVAYPRFEVSFAKDESAAGSVNTKADCGFIQFAKGDYRLQFGADEEQINPVTRFNQDFTKGLGSFSNAGAVTVPGTTWADKANATSSTKGLTPAYGKLTKEWHGSYLTANSVATGDFELSWKQCFALSSTATTAKKQKGVFAMLALDASNNVVAGIRIEKTGTTSTKGKVKYIVGGTVVNTVDVDLKYKGLFGYVSKTDTSTNKTSTVPRHSTNIIKRENGEIVFKLASDTQEYRHYDLNTTAIAKVGVFFGQYDTATVASRNTLLSAKFVDGDVGNTFTSGDILDVDCETALIQLNNSYALGLGDVTNAWSDFYLDRGRNIINVAWSSWVVSNYEPTPLLIYRKRWL